MVIFFPSSTRAFTFIFLQTNFSKCFTCFLAIQAQNLDSIFTYLEPISACQSSPTNSSIYGLAFTPSSAFLWWLPEFRPLTSCWFSAIPFVCVSAREYILVFSSDCRIPLLKTHQRLLLLNFTFQLPKPIYNLVPTYHVHSLLCARTHYTLLRMSCSLFPDFFALPFCSLIPSSGKPKLCPPSKLQLPVSLTPSWPLLSLTQLSLTHNTSHSMWHLQVLS